MTVPPTLLSVNVGLPKNVAWQGKTADPDGNTWVLQEIGYRMS